jgi:AcrR family transcriptional regulator
MVRRAESVDQKRTSILDAATAMFWDEPSRELTLEAIAARSGVTVQTVIRHFGGRDGLFEAAVNREFGRVGEERDPRAVSTPAEAIRQLVAHYERTGDQAIRMLAEEHRSPVVAELAERGRIFHREWCEVAFNRTLSRLSGSSRRRRLAQLVAVCDVYTWKLLRRDAALDRRATELAMVELLNPLLEVL